jgi:hypothetical protein
LERPVTLYAIFDPKPDRTAPPAAVPEAFSWFAAILPPVFLLRHGLWLETLAYALGAGALVAASRLIGNDAAFVLYALAALWIGFAAAGFRRHALRWRGWSHRGPVIASSADLAQLEALR